MKRTSSFYSKVFEKYAVHAEDTKLVNIMDQQMDGIPEPKNAGLNEHVSPADLSETVPKNAGYNETETETKASKREEIKKKWQESFKDMRHRSLKTG